jgi:hypothetical protein
MLRLLALALALAGCAAAPPAFPSAARREGCPDLSELPRIESRYREARALIEACDELCRKSGKQDRRALPWLEQAAEAGHREAQAFYGKHVFDFTLVMGDDSDPETKERWATSVAYLRLAARRGSVEARDYIPALEALTIRPDGSFEPPLEPPLSIVPGDSLREGIGRADRAFDCYR